MPAERRRPYRARRPHPFRSVKEHIDGSAHSHRRAAAAPATGMRPPLIAVPLVLATLALAACSRGDAPSATTPPAKVSSPKTEASLTTITLTDDAVRRLGIETVAIAQKGITRTRTVGGDVMPAGGAQTTVTAPFAGTLEAGARTATVGATIAKGTPVFRLVALSPGDRDARIEAERLASEAEGRHEMAARRVERATLLVKDGSGSQRAVEEAQADLVAAAAALKAARDRLAIAARQMSTSGSIALDAPDTALLRAVYATPGQTVAAGAPLFDLVRLDGMWIRVPLFGAEAEGIDPRAPARIVPLGADESTAGLIATPIAAPPSADPSTASVDLFFTLAGAQGSGRGADIARFRPGQRVGVRVSLRGDAPRLVAPAAALLHDAYGGAWVYEMRDAHTFIRRRVAVADLVNGLAVLDQGPPVGTRVVTAGAAELFGTEFGVGK